MCQNFEKTSFIGDPSMEFFILGLQALKSMHSRMQDSVEGSQVLHDRPRMSTTTIDFDYLVCSVPLLVF